MFFIKFGVLDNNNKKKILIKKILKKNEVVIFFSFWMNYLLSFLNNKNKRFFEAIFITN